MQIKPLPLALAALALSAWMGWGSASAQEKEIPIWPGVAPGSEHWIQKETQSSEAPFHTRIARNVTRPTITVFRPSGVRPNSTAVVICPGGGFVMEELDKEGTDLARWLNQRGVTAIVLKYRLKETPAKEEDFLRQFNARFRNRRHVSIGPTTPVSSDEAAVRKLAIADGAQAVRVVRRNSAEWGIDPHRIGILGFSAGGVVSVGVGVHHDAESRPDFVASVYSGLRDKSPVPADAAPMFIVCASDDPLVDPKTSTKLYDDWSTRNPLTELHIFMKGGHGFGITQRHLPVDQWVQLYAEWMAQLGWMNR